MMSSQSISSSQSFGTSDQVEVRAGSVYLKLPKTDSNVELVKATLDSLKEKAEKSEK